MLPGSAAVGTVINGYVGRAYIGRSPGKGVAAESVNRLGGAVRRCNNNAWYGYGNNNVHLSRYAGIVVIGNADNGVYRRRIGNRPGT